MNVTEAVRKILEEDPEVAILLFEILAPPPSLAPRPQPWET